MHSPNEETLLARAIAALHSVGFIDDLAAWLQTSLKQDNVTALTYFQNNPPELLMSQSSIPQVHNDFESVYLAGVYILDPFYELHQKNAPNGLYRISDIAPDHFHRNRYFIEYYQKTTIIDEIAFVCTPAPGLSLHLCLGRDATSNTRFSQKQLRKAQSIAPIVLSLAHHHWANHQPKQTATPVKPNLSLVDLMHKTHQINLTPRQAEVALLILRGHSTVSIALRLGISKQTVKVFRKQLYSRCQITSQAELFSLLLPILGSYVKTENQDGS